ncbi:hypothetical protein IAR55_002316 [Kwoniella newhampshirensis]|uniref:Uncharacterized protein n=1 Tax=Kwoniella newhampshirensis TaxID=1651941 RepID=A0AAW0Z0U6_9TREE
MRASYLASIVLYATLALGHPTPDPVEVEASSIDTFHAPDASSRIETSIVEHTLLEQEQLGHDTTLDQELVDLGSDPLGRKITKRGLRIMIEEPRDLGRQWGGADEMDDESDEPYWG